MATKIFVTLKDGPANDAKSESVKRRVADALGICCEDVVVLNGVTALNVVDVPDALKAARVEADRKAAEESKAAEEAAAKAEAEAAEKAKTEAAAAPVAA